jgi:hypothetical protein
VSIGLHSFGSLGTFVVTHECWFPFLELGDASSARGFAYSGTFAAIPTRAVSKKSIDVGSSGTKGIEFRNTRDERRALRALFDATTEGEEGDGCGDEPRRGIHGWSVHRSVCSENRHAVEGEFNVHPSHVTQFVTTTACSCFLRYRIGDVDRTSTIAATCGGRGSSASRRRQALF